MGRKSTNNYLTSEEIYQEWKKWKETGTISETMGWQMLTLARHIMESRSFARYPQSMKDEMVSDGCLKIQTNLKNMKEEMKGSFFSYWTRCVFTAAITYLKKHYQEQNRRRDYIRGEVEKMMCGEYGDVIQSEYLKQILETIENWNSKPKEEEE